MEAKRINIDWKDNPYRNNDMPGGKAILASNGIRKKERSKKLGIPSMNDQALLNIIDDAEKKYDAKNSTHLFTTEDQYPRNVVLSKVAAARSYLTDPTSPMNPQEAQEWNNSYFIVTDNNWKIGDTYINKPSSDPSGFEVGKNKIIEMVQSSDGKELVGEGWVARFNLQNNKITLYRFTERLGRLKDNLSGEEINKLEKMISDYRYATSGFDLETIITKLDILDDDSYILLEMREFDENGVDISMNINGNFYGVALKKKDLIGNIDAIEGWKTGIIGPGFNLNLDTLLI